MRSMIFVVFLVGVPFLLYAGLYMASLFIIAMSYMQEPPDNDSLVVYTNKVWLALISPCHMLADGRFEQTSENGFWKAQTLWALFSIAKVVLLIPSIVIGAILLTLGHIVSLLRDIGRAIIEKVICYTVAG